MKLLWSAQSEQDRTNIFDFIAAADPSAALRMDRLFAQSVERLPEHPFLGRPGKIKGTRELIPHENYRLVYEVVDNEIRILTIVHVTRLWPPAD
jgi:toxin ParE1/3/4